VESPAALDHPADKTKLIKHSTNSVTICLPLFEKFGQPRHRSEAVFEYLAEENPYGNQNEYCVPKMAKAVLRQRQAIFRLCNSCKVCTSPESPSWFLGHLRRNSPRPNALRIHCNRKIPRQKSVLKSRNWNSPMEPASVYDYLTSRRSRNLHQPSGFGYGKHDPLGTRAVELSLQAHRCC